MSTAHADEEKEEIRKHAELYSTVDDARLRMKSTDWTKFDGMKPSDMLDPYSYFMGALGSVAGLRVLDTGCGDGWFSVILANRGAQVDAFDISPEGVSLARRRAALNVEDASARCRFASASFYDIPFPDAAYDLVTGHSILHHLGDKRAAASELRRVMKPGAKAMFTEPFGDALWLERLRLRVPVASEAPEDPDEWQRQFKYADLAPFRDAGFRVEVKEELHLLSRIERVVRARPLVGAVKRLDRWLLAAIPPLRRYARAVVVTLHKL